MERAHVG